MCDCIIDINARLAENNAKLVCGFIMNPSLHQVVTVQVDRLNQLGRKAIPPRVRYCPFCGEAYLSAGIETVGYAPGNGEKVPT